MDWSKRNSRALLFFACLLAAWAAVTAMRLIDPILLVILVNAVSGTALANQRRLYQARLLNLSTFQMLSDVLFYEALPNIFDGIRTAVSYSLVLVVAVEMFIGLGERGLGRGIYL